MNALDHAQRIIDETEAKTGKPWDMVDKETLALQLTGSALMGAIQAMQTAQSAELETQNRKPKGEEDYSHERYLQMQKEILSGLLTEIEAKLSKPSGFEDMDSEADLSTVD